MEFFNKTDFDLLQEFSGKLKTDELNDQYNLLKKTYNKVGFWSDLVKNELFPEGKVDIRKRPTNQANIIEWYQWGKIYPTKEDYQYKKLAYTLSIEKNTKLVVKIDTVGLVEKDPLRIIYYDYRKSEPIVKEFYIGEVNNWDELKDLTINYIKLLEPHYHAIHKIFNDNQKKIGNTNYWVFQGNPKFYDVEGALKSNVITNWKVGAHKTNIENGDKIILWLTGEKSGCYGLGQTTSEVGKLEMTDEEKSFYKTDFDPNDDRVGVSITNNLYSDPVLWNDIKDNPILSGLNVGNQGTNFRATEEQYNELLRLSQTDHKKMNHPLNQILFGCPGSGKTYSTKRLAVEIITNKEFGDSEEDRKEILRLYDHYSEQKQITFTTFHQSLSYEDFIEGIKPVMKGDEEGDLNYEIQDGIFKNICKIAVKTNGATTVDNFDETWEALIELVKSEISNSKLLKIGSWEYGLSSKNSLKYSSLNTPSQYSFTITKQNILDTYQNKKARPSGAFQKDMEDIVKFMKSHFHLSEYKSDPLREEQFSDKKYVLIIDEINRGNVSSIFGELITLIEDDKRLGNDEKIEVTLPYSKESFGVPPNLYIIGTMNTADRSVESLDTALRRRFSFTEMKSDPEIIRKNNTNSGIVMGSPNVDLVDLLTTINQRIELLIDKDHQIGHSYFISINSLPDLKFTFKNKIVPLLEEYFYGDFGKIGLVLGNNFVETQSLQNNKNVLLNFKGYEDVDFLTDKKIYTFKDIDGMTPQDFVSIYKNVKTEESEA